jgi:hypothetical protein
MYDSNGKRAEQRTAHAIAVFQGEDEGCGACRLLKKAATTGGSCFRRFRSSGFSASFKIGVGES